MRYASNKRLRPELPAALSAVFAAAIVFATLGTSARAAEPANAPVPHFRKVLFLGNSITLHGPSKKIDWTGNWGMAASAADKDYVHIVTQAIVLGLGAEPKTMVKNIATFERNYSTYDLKENLKDAVDFKADLVILAIGENVPGLASDEAKVQFETAVLALLKLVRGDRRPTIVVRSCFWPNRAKDAALQQACRQVGGVYVDISALSKDEANYARSERKIRHPGVAAHPGDRGMQAIADAILDALKR